MPFNAGVYKEFDTELFMKLTSEYRFTRKMLKNIVLFKDNILEQIYIEWVRSDYSHQEHIEYIIRTTLKELNHVELMCAKC